MTATNERDVFSFGVIKRDAEILTDIPGAIEDGVSVLIAIDRRGLTGFFPWGREATIFSGAAESPPEQSGELKSCWLARLLRTT